MSAVGVDRAVVAVVAAAGASRDGGRAVAGTIIATQHPEARRCGAFLIL